MSALRSRRHQQAGVSLIEVLVTLFVLMVGLLGVAGLSLQSQRAAMESFQRNQALFLMQDMVSRINANRTVADCYAISDASTGLPNVGVDSTTWPACSAGTIEAYSQANRDLAAWDELLRGATVTTDGVEVGAMIGARGCIVRLAANRYLVSVAWQGLNATAAPSTGIACGLDQYGNEALRRVVALPLQIADLRGT